jgi:serine/threonine protein kinase
MHIDSGAYGSVSQEGGFAVKRFQKLNHAVQEYLALVHLKSSKWIVKPHSCNFTDLERPLIKMELMDGTLASWYREIVNKTDLETFQSLMLDALCQVLLGICDIHDRKLVHGDIKPNNILYKRQESHAIRIYIGDCGFVSLAKYSKTERTARPYRDPHPTQHYGHDIYSFAIIFLQLYGGANIYSVNDSNMLSRIIYEHIFDRKYRQILLQMVRPNAEDRPTARQCLHELFSIQVPTYQPSYIDEFVGIPLTEQENAAIRKFLISKSNKYSLNHSHKSYNALTYYLQSCKIHHSEHILHCIALLYILASMFATTSRNLSWEQVLHMLAKHNYNHYQFLDVLQLMVNNINFVQFLLYDSQ